MLLPHPPIDRDLGLDGVLKLPIHIMHLSLIVPSNGIELSYHGLHLKTLSDLMPLYTLPQTQNNRANAPQFKPLL